MASLTWKPYRRSQAPQVVRLWNRAMGPAFPMSTRLFRQNTENPPSHRPDDSTVVSAGDQVVGYIRTTRFREQDPLLESMANVGWIDAVMVDPDWQRRGLGRDLMTWAMYKLRSEGAGKVYLGGGFRHFLPGVPQDSPELAGYFARWGFDAVRTVWDLRGNLRGFGAPPAATQALAAARAAVAPCHSQDVPALLAFLQAEFPGRWRFDTMRYLDLGGAPEDLVLLKQDGLVTGFAHIWHRRSVFMGPPTFWHSLLGRNYGGLGPIGVAERTRGQGLGLALLQLSLQQLAGMGVADAVIDWTDLLDFYAKVGFLPWKAYWRMEAQPLA